MRARLHIDGCHTCLECVGDVNQVQRPRIIVYYRSVISQISALTTLTKLNYKYLTRYSGHQTCTHSNSEGLRTEDLANPRNNQQKFKKSIICIHVHAKASCYTRVVKSYHAANVIKTPFLDQKTKCEFSAACIIIYCTCTTILYVLP